MNRRNLARAGGVFAGMAMMGAMAAKPAFACLDDDLKAAIEDMRQAMIAGNGARLLELMSDECTFGHANGVVQTKLEFVKTVVEKTEVFKAITLKDHWIDVTGDTGLARHTFDADINFMGKDMQLTLGIMQVWRNEEGRWRLVARQSFKPITV